MKNELIVNAKPISNFSEDVRTIRTNIEFLMSEKEEGNKVFLITSTSQGEGKSFVISNLACAFAKNDKKVLIIDCDLRLGRIHKIFKTSFRDGLSNLIAKYDGRVNINNYIKHTNIENLDIITRGTTPPNPSELLGSDRFKKILDKLYKKYDYIFIDCVPVRGLPDSLVVSNLVDKTIIVCKYGIIDQDDLLETKKTLENVNANIAGVILNDVPEKKNRYGSYNSYYSYYSKRGLL